MVLPLDQNLTVSESSRARDSVSVSGSEPDSNGTMEA